MHTYKNTMELKVIPKIGDITDMGSVVLVTEDKLLISDHGRERLLSTDTVILVIRNNTIQ